MNRDVNCYLNSSLGRLDQFKEFIDELEGDLSVVEFGPGSGATLVQIRESYRGARITGFDIYPAFVDENIEIIKADLNKFDFQAYSKILENGRVFLFLDVLEHLITPLDFIGKIDDYVSGSARFVISCPNFSSVRMLFAWIKGRMPRNDLGFFDKTHLQWLAPYDFALLFKARGHRDIRISYIYSNNKIVRLIQSIFPSRFCSQFLIFSVK